jgi:hypothetical protein
MAIWLAACATVVGGAAGVLLGLGYTDWEWDNPRRMLKVSGRMLMLAIMMAFFIVIMVGLRTPEAGAGIVSGWAAVLRFMILTGTPAAAVTYVLLRVSAGKLRALEWRL